MARRSPTWKCQRITAKARCGHENPSRKRLCEKCGRPRPARRRPAHMSALDLPYEYYVAINGGEHCGVCGVKPAPGKRHHRDHDHEGVGFARGLACFRCNSALRPYMNAAWLRKALTYVERAEARRPK